MRHQKVGAVRLARDRVIRRPVQQFDAGLPEAVAAALREARVAPALIEIEITETMLVQDVASTLSTLKGLQDMDVRLSIDDFGTGYSSLAYLKRFEIDILKVDQSFVRDVLTDVRREVLGEAAP